MSSEESVQQTPAGLTGERLKAARESKGLAVADVARAQHLRLSVIQAIESGDYEQIGSELFLKGYVRAYAAQVGLDQEATIAQLDQELEPLRQKKAEAQQENPLITIEQRKRRKKRIARTVFILLVLGLVAYAGYRLIPGMLQPSDDSALMGETGDRAVEPVPAEEEVLVSPVEDARERTDSEAAQESVVDSDVTTVEVAAPATENEAVEEESGSSALALEEPQAEPIAAPDDAVAEPAAESVPESEETLPVDVSGVRLQATFVADCWVSVTDGEGKTLVSSLRRAGGGFDVSGEPPLKVVIGAADAVGSLTFQGQAVSLSDYRVVNNRVQFSLQ